MTYKVTADTVISIPLVTITALAGAAVVACAAPFSGTVETISAAVNGAFTVSNIVITGRIDTTGITTGVVTLATSGSGFGTTASVSPTAAKTFTAGQIINFTITGGVGAVSGAVTFVLRKS